MLENRFVDQAHAECVLKVSNLMTIQEHVLNANKKSVKIVHHIQN